MKLNLGIRHNYIVLQDRVLQNRVLHTIFPSGDFISLEEQGKLHHAIVNVLPPVSPTESFVTQLEQALLKEGRSLPALSPSLSLLQTIGLVLGGILPIVGGIAAWVLWRRRQREKSNLHPTPPTVVLQAS
ncbi:MAG: hypothetical protein JXA33_16845 [Anaerolineae bacterium]|nr:hypothetical protein [Anaerolineae bacterium]